MFANIQYINGISLQVRVRVRFSRKPTSSTVSTDLKSKGKIRVSTSDVSGRARTAAKDERSEDASVMSAVRP